MPHHKADERRDDPRAEQRIAVGGIRIGDRALVRVGIARSDSSGEEPFLGPGAWP
ncbi:hypothetical protein AB0J21_22620 [Streptomyces sp. NPDC049954]|uniref:hypothetical protein n=1 Tax=Streptomyces sp. NPDC049954 TaxID=3155779 RepID=UPI00344409CE